jgi:hypothetical protein
MLRSLKLYGMANAVEDLVSQGAPAFEAATPLLSQLLKAEIAEREVRSIAYHTKVARFPAGHLRYPVRQVLIAPKDALMCPLARPL